jgi:hypothetical protein
MTPATAKIEDAEQYRWLVLFHQLPPKPAYMRVKVWRRLQALGAVIVKNSVYVLPQSEAARESLLQLLHEIRNQNGEAAICEAEFIAGASDADIIKLFQNARDEDYEALAKEIDEAARSWTSGANGPLPVWSPEVRTQLTKFHKRWNEIQAIDYFSAPAGRAVETTLQNLEASWKVGERRSDEQARLSNFSGRTWVTRKGIGVDRIASAWLIRRFIDQRAKFKFIDAKTYVQQPAELRFDMNEAEFTHIGDMCTFEVLVQQTKLDSHPALRALAEIIHELDLKDGKYNRPEATGIGLLLEGIVAQNAADPERLARGTELFENLYRQFDRQTLAAPTDSRNEIAVGQ